MTWYKSPSQTWLATVNAMHDLLQEARVIDVADNISPSSEALLVQVLSGTLALRSQVKRISALSHDQER